MHSRILSDCAAAGSIAGPLVTLFCQSLTSGCLPEGLRLGTVVPIYKRGGKSLPEKYTPVSQTSEVCKIFEAVIQDQLMDFLIQENNVF